MLFTSWPFVGFVVVVATIYYLPSFRRRQLPWLVVTSLALYASMVGAMFWLLVGCGLLTALVSWRVGRQPQRAARRAWAVVGIVGNLCALACFKYGRLAGGLFAPDNAVAGLLLLPIPAGISFYTFHGISLIVDVWRGTWTPPPRGGRHAATSALYLVFFPQLIAGPIVRARDFLSQVGPKNVATIRWSIVARAIITGAFLKLVVADHLAVLTVDLDAPWIIELPGLNLTGLVVAYAMQLFADFAAYSSLAVGLAELFGFTLPRNFAFPYLSESIGEFWRRWHISLGAWLRDYLYIPLGGNKRTATRNAGNLLLTMTLAGLWHGAAWGYAVWGLWSGAGMVVERALGLDPSRSRWWGVRALRIVGVFAFINVGWLFFRLRSVGAAYTVLRAAVAHAAWTPNVFPLASIAWFSLPVVVYHGWGRLQERRADVAERWAMPLLGLLLAWTLVDAAPPTPFIYFQF